MMDFIQINYCIAHHDFMLDVDVSIPAMGVTALFGPSGSGKTTLLRCIAGFSTASVGRCIVGGGDQHDRVWQNNTINLPAHQRPIGYVFQEASLFSHLSVFDNLRYAQKRAWPSGNKKPPDIEQLSVWLGLEHLLNRQPYQLSGGERQRVAIARALLINPALLLMDEPLASLDIKSKQEILPYLERVCHELKLPVIYVTHSPDEAARLADHLVGIGFFNARN